MNVVCANAIVILEKDIGAVGPDMSGPQPFRKKEFANMPRARHAWPLPRSLSRR